MVALSTLYQKACAVKPRVWLSAGFLSCLGMELSAVYFQFVLGLEPCPLCITQRMILFSLASVFLAGALHNPGRAGRRVYAGLAALFCLAGAGVAAYHFLIQILPHDDFASCGPGASYILAHFSLADSVRMFLTGTGDCTQVVWTFLGLSMPFWVCLAFLGLLALCLWQFALAAPRVESAVDALAVAETE
jgi:disulfide bond formation protein DsbB